VGALAVVHAQAAKGRRPELGAGRRRRGQAAQQGLGLQQPVSGLAARRAGAQVLGDGACAPDIQHAVNIGGEILPV